MKVKVRLLVNCREVRRSPGCGTGEGNLSFWNVSDIACERGPTGSVSTLTGHGPQLHRALYFLLYFCFQGDEVLVEERLKPQAVLCQDFCL